MTPLNYGRLAEKLVDNGFSVTSQGIEPTSGFVVSIRGFESKFDRHVNALDLPQIISAYHHENMGAMRALQSVGITAYLGGWRNGSDLVLDISIGVPTLAEALLIGKQNKQLAVYDVENGVSIDVVPEFRGHPVF